MPEITDADVRTAYERLRTECQLGGYFLNPDEAFTLDLVKSLLTNERRYGYRACPCRLASGSADDDRDIVCPCDYRDPDIAEHGACYCALYVAEAAAKGERRITTIPDRRPAPEERRTDTPPPGPEGRRSFPYPVWRCRVCGYLCAREEPPETCPICKVKKERFERFA
jgi:ferredoxin-thioredoxin reductase catalytic subunit/rubredoxin